MNYKNKSVATARLEPTTCIVALLLVLRFTNCAVGAEGSVFISDI